jgi:outer membrane protein assembly factor BamD (BamD/ComL family)
MKRGILFLTIIPLMLAFIIGCQKGPTAEDVFNEAKQLQEDANYTDAVTKYEKLVQTHPKSRYAPQAQFMIGFIYANELDDLDKAKVAYEKFLEVYASESDSGMVASAEWELRNLGKDINEIEDLSLTPEGEGGGDETEQEE